jgi:hypothetical protein
MKNNGYIVEYTDKAGKVQKAKSLFTDQKPNFSDWNKCFLRLLNNDFTEQTDENGKKLIAIKHISEVKIVGYIN